MTSSLSQPARLPSAAVMLTVLTATAAAQSPVPVATQLAARAAAPALQEADLAWDRGDYPDALRGYQALLGGTPSDAVRRSIALTTGELYASRELAPDGRLLRVSPDGRYVAFEAGTGEQRRVHVHALADGRRVGAEYAAAPAFSADGSRLAVVRRASPDSSTISLYELPAWRERAVRLPGLATTTGPVFDEANRALLVLAGAPRRDTTVTLYSVPLAGGAPRALTTSPTVKGDLTLLPGGRHVSYTEGRRTRFGPPGVTVVRDLRTGTERRIQGTAVSASADGSALVYLARSGDTTKVQLLPLAGGAEARTVVATTDRVDAPALSPSGRVVAYQRMPKEDWELFLVNADGTGDRRFTREIQHDLVPRFLSEDRLLAVLGEGRHRRSFLYDVATGARTRLFHNNTVRTIAPEYEWAATPDGSKVVIVSERDGDTISPERGVYLMDLGRELTTAELRGRLDGMLAAETALRRQGEALFAPVRDRVRAAVAQVSMATLYEYQQRLSEFGSRFVGMPGNGPAGQWLHDTFAAMGYEPELQWFEPMGLARTANVVATLPGTTHPEIVYVVGAHYDSHRNGPGADDDASGTAMVLELARVLKARPLPATVVFVLFTGEEAGLLGSREFARRAVADGWHVGGALNNDMFGWSNDHRLDNTIRYSNDGIRDVQHASAFLFSDLVTYDARYYKSTDAHALFDAFGDVIGGTGSYPVLANPHYHQAHDLLETINQEQVTETTKATLAALMLMASSPERTREVRAAPEGGATVVTWAPALEKDVTGYQVRWQRAGDGTVQETTVTEPRARLTGVKAGTPVLVRAVNRDGLVGWDWASDE